MQQHNGVIWWPQTLLGDNIAAHPMLPVARRKMTNSRHAPSTDVTIVQAPLITDLLQQEPFVKSRNCANSMIINQDTNGKDYDLFKADVKHGFSPNQTPRCLFGTPYLQDHDWTFHNFMFILHNNPVSIQFLRFIIVHRVRNERNYIEIFWVVQCLDIFKVSN